MICRLATIAIVARIHNAIRQPLDKGANDDHIEYADNGGDNIHPERVTKVKLFNKEVAWN